MKFSQKYGFTAIKNSIQVDSMDEDLRNGLWNVFSIVLLDKIDNGSQRTELYTFFIKSLWLNFFKKPVDSIRVGSMYSASPKEILRDWFFKEPWFLVYDLLEFTVKLDIPHFDKRDFIESINIILQREVAGYRVIDNCICPITNDAEIQSIENTLSATTNIGLGSVNQHSKEALLKLSDRKNPDYRNSIKESISAVEALVKIITNSPNATLGDGLKKLKQTIQIHPALEKGFLNIYGYTSDGDGIRHAMMEESKLDFEDAKYMLVSCSAFINYLIEKAQKAGIKLN